MSADGNVFWDTCVFWRYITRSPTELLNDIDSFIADAKNKKRKIYFSTISFVELKPSIFVSRTGDLRSFFNDMAAAFEPIDPNPNILLDAGELRDTVVYDKSEGTVSKRVIGTGDSIQLTSCLYAKEVLGINDIVFHSFDKGRSASWEGKCTPILGFEDWFPADKRTRMVQKICDLKRQEPLYPQPDLLSGGQ